MVWLVNFPLPPSVNEYLMPVPGRVKVNQRTGKLYKSGAFVKTELHRKYMDTCHQWRALHNKSFGEIQDHLLGLVHKARADKRRVAFRVDHYFALEDSRLWTVNNLPERLDADNRLKPCRDALSTLLGIDDKYFFSGYFEKVSTNSKELECSAIRISLMTPRTLQDLREQIKAERMKPATL